MAFNLSDLTSATGFRINGFNPNGNVGLDLASIGDMNGDGIDDIAISAPGVFVTVPPLGGALRGGHVYVVFGSETEPFPDTFDLRLLNGSNGFTIIGSQDATLTRITSSLQGGISEAGDFNNDGIDDLIVVTDGIGALATEPESLNQARVIFGSEDGFTATMDMADFSTSDGITISIDFSNTSQFAGRTYSVSGVGDFNNDGISDVALGVPTANYNLDGAPLPTISGGGAFVIMGSASATDVNISTQPPEPGVFPFYGSANNLSIGHPVEGIGDINGDGYDDFLAGNGPIQTDRKVYVIFGDDSTGGLPSRLLSAELDGSNGFVVQSSSALATAQQLGHQAASLGDINGDGIDDFAISAPIRDGVSNPAFGPGRVHVIYGKTTEFSASFDVEDLDGSNGFTIVGEQALDFAGFSVSSAGDVNGDGIQDILIGAYQVVNPNAAGTGGGFGSAYVVFGKDEDFPNAFDLSAISPVTGLEIITMVEDQFGFATEGFAREVSSAGDFNNDGFDDIMISSTLAVNTAAGEGAVHVIYGSANFGNLGSTPVGAGGPDFDANGTDDILFFNEDTRTVGQFSMPSASWGGIGTAGTGWEARGVGLFDSDDTSSDILWFNTQTRAVGRFDMVDGVRDSWKGIGQAGTGWEVKGAGDFNADGVDDILWFNDATNSAGQYRLDATGAASWVGIGSTGLAWEIAGIADFNGDAYSDVLWYNESTSSLGQFRMSDTGRSWVGVTGLGSGFEVAGTGDFNGDGIDDILVFNETTRALGQFDMDGGAPDWISLGTSGSGWSLEGTGDFNGDGRDDILWRHSDGRIGQYQMDGAEFSWAAIGVAGSEWDVIL